VTVQFTYEGKAYEIDLNKRNAKKFDDLLKPWITAGRRVTARPGTARKSTTASRPCLPGAGPGVGEGSTDTRCRLAGGLRSRPWTRTRLRTDLTH
jgi:hypothetical protein